MTNVEKQLEEWINVNLRKTENILSELDSKKPSTLTNEDMEQWANISFRKMWILSQIDSIIQK